MKKITIILLCFMAVSCSKSEETANTPVANTDNKINLPSWLDGVYKADNVSLQYPYPKSQPHSMTFKSNNDIIIKGASNSLPESLQSKIDGFISSDKLISVSEEYDINTHINYQLVITSKPTPPVTGWNYIHLTISQTGIPNTIQVLYKTSIESSYYTGQSYYKLQ